MTPGVSEFTVQDPAPLPAAPPGGIFVVIPALSRDPWWGHRGGEPGQDVGAPILGNLGKPRLRLGEQGGGGADR